MICVTVAEVAWWPGTDTADGRLVVYAPDGELPIVGVPDRASAQMVAARHWTGSRTGISEEAPVLEPVTFFEGADHSIRVVYTAAAPVAATMLDADRRPVTDPKNLGWQDLTALSAEATDKVPWLVRNYWRQELEESTAVFDFLPKYFTTSQAREIYDCVWGSPQDPGNFHRWLHKQNQGICREVTTKAEIISDRDQEAAQFVAKTGGAAAQPLLPVIGAALESAGMIGSSLYAVGLAKVMPAVAAGAVVAGGRIAYQAAKQRGPQPQWYTRTSRKRINLAALYGPRPDWLKPGKRRRP